MEETIKALTARIEALETDLEHFREMWEQHDERRQNEAGRLRDDLRQETRDRENGDYQLERSISNVERSVENAQRTADSAYSAAQHSGSRW